MSKCELSISFDNDKLTYQPGDIVKCTVHVTVNKAVACKQLTIKKFWQTHGRGNRDSAISSTDTLFSGEWEPGEYQYAYSFIVEDEPFTYHGNILNIDWYLLAQADIPWALDPKAKTEFIVEKPRKASGSTIELMNLDVASTAGAKKSKLIPAIVSIGFFCLIAAIFIVPNALPNISVWEIIGAVIGFIVVLIIIAIIRSKILLAKLGPVDVIVDPNDLSPEESCNVEVSFTPNKNIFVNHFSALLIGSETAVSGSGTNETTHHSAIHRKMVTLNQDAQYVAGMSYSEKTTFVIPSDAPACFDSFNNHISWRVELVMDIKSCPDWKHREDIHVN